MSGDESRIDVHDSPWAILRFRDYRRFLTGNLLALFASQMQTTVVGWELYQRAGRPLELGLVGLAQLLPILLLAIPAGHIADRFERRKVVMIATFLFSLSSLGLMLVSLWEADLWWYYPLLFLGGVARSFNQPAKGALLPTLVPPAAFARAVTWNTSGFQLATILGPALGGFLVTLVKPFWIYLLDALLTLTFIGFLLTMPRREAAAAREPLTWRSLLGGVEFVWKTKIILGALALDMFAVLLGGATALLPIYARDILQVDAQGLGWLRGAPGVGALVMSVLLTHLPPIRRAGWTLLWSVAGFGIATIIFGLTRNFWLATAMLFLTGALDMISVIIRHTLVQISTPNEMRGRVSAVNTVFISVSNELGAAESGLVAQLFDRPGDAAFGPTISVVSGGIGTILVTALTALYFPTLRRRDHLDPVADQEEQKTNDGM
ncbi:MAG: MFS transporter [Planctomycetota bacterium]